MHCHPASLDEGVRDNICNRCQHSRPALDMLHPPDLSQPWKLWQSETEKVRSSSCVETAEIGAVKLSSRYQSSQSLTDLFLARLRTHA